MGPLRRPIRVVDLSALWAGPLCGAILAAAGCDVTKVEAVDRMDWKLALKVGFAQAMIHRPQYLVLDEFHTYDGAQGTDVAMLLRRLGVTPRQVVNGVVSGSR